MPTASPKREHVWLLYSSSSTSASAGPWPIACFITDQHPPPRPQPRLRSPTTRQMLPFKTSLIRLLLEKISERNHQMGQARILETKDGSTVGPRCQRSCERCRTRRAERWPDSRNKPEN